MKIERNIFVIIVFFGTFQLSNLQQICDEGRYVRPFLEALDNVADQIIQVVPDWLNYTVRPHLLHDNRLLFSFNETQTPFFEPEIYFDYRQPKATTDQPLNSSDEDAICDRRGFRYNQFPTYSRRRNIPYKILRWLHSYSQIEEFVIQISKKNSSLGLRYEENNVTRKSIRSKGLNITYFANQIYGNESRPSVCELYFYIRGTEQTWNSSQDQVSFTFGEDDDEQMLNVTGTLENVIVGFMLLSRTEGKQVSSTSIDEVMKIVLNSLPRVLCNPSENACPEGTFDCRCGNNIYQRSYSPPTCIPSRWRCDGTPDCPDGIDEENCICPEGFFQCGCEKGGTCPYRFECIPNSYLCDGIQDCESYKDETVNECAFNCATEQRSIRSTLRCDGKRDCQDFSDEVNCQKHPPKLPYRCDCAKDDFHCSGNYSFYSEEERCNGVKFCSDFSDEWNCTKCPPEKLIRCNCNKKENFTCEETYSCFSYSSICDLKSDCSDNTDEKICTYLPCPVDRPVSCNCNQFRNFTCGQFHFCYNSDEHRCDGVAQCSDASDEWDCPCPESKPFECGCKKLRNSEVCLGDDQCFTEADKCNGNAHCDDWTDELHGCLNCPVQLPNRCGCNTPGNFSCKGRACYSENSSCDEINDCGDWSDERNCTWRNCTFAKCDCNGLPCSHGPNCYTEKDKCNSIADCKDETDEMNCSCPVGMFSCSCFTANSPTCSKQEGCIEYSNVNDGEYLCPDESDEQYLISRFDLPPCGLCTNLTIFRLNSLQGCNEIASCDNSTCKEVVGFQCKDLDCAETNFICFSKCIDNSNTNCKTFFQCQNKEIILGHKFCNEQIDCEDGSDEIYTGFGFKCHASEESTRSCVLPQWNLKDEDTFQCYNNMDTCKGDFGCFDCLNNPRGQLRISNYQVCDGLIDCEDLSDECLCRTNFHEQICLDRFAGNNHLNPTPICVKVNDYCSIARSVHVSEATCRLSTREDIKNTCQSKSREIEPTYCDKIPECINFEDECNATRCKTLPKYCSDPCSHFFQIGDRYCNGYEDDAWIYLNDSACPKGFDERPELCEDTRFSCTVNGQSKVPQVSIPKTQYRDGIKHCDDGSDEAVNNIFLSSSTEMIGIGVIRTVIWIIAIIALFANASVIITTTHILKTKKLHKILRTNHSLILNLSIADFFMGIYLLIISIKSVEFSGRYGEVDLRWRSSNLCTVAGTIAIISRETSCFIMTILISFRLVNVLRPIKSQTTSTRIWFVILGFAWMTSCLIAIVPLIPQLGDVFINRVWFDSPFAQNQLLKKDEILLVTCRYKSFLNLNDSLQTSTWHDILNFSQNNFPKFETNLVGFYGETSVCMPRFFVDNTDAAGFYSIFIISINFILFCYIGLSYVLIYKITLNRRVSTKQVEIQNNKMQKRIARLHATNFLCWIPLCIVAFVKYTTRIELSSDIYAATFAFFLTINSALNPILYSAKFEKLFRMCTKCCIRK